MFALASKHPAGEGAGKRQVVCGYDYRCARVGNLMQVGHNLRAGVGVEVSCWLVGDDKPRIIEQSSGYGNALLFAATELVGHLEGLGLHAYPAQHLVDAGIALILSRQPVAASTKSRLSHAVRSVSNWKSWKTMPMRLRR